MLFIEIFCLPFLIAFESASMKAPNIHVTNFMVFMVEVAGIEPASCVISDNISTYVSGN